MSSLTYYVFMITYIILYLHDYDGRGYILRHIISKCLIFFVCAFVTYMVVLVQKSGTPDLFYSITLAKVHQF